MKNGLNLRPYSKNPDIHVYENYACIIRASIRLLIPLQLRPK